MSRLYQYGCRADEFQALNRLATLTKTRAFNGVIKVKNPHKKLKFALEARTPVASTLPLWIGNVCGYKPDDSDIASVIDGVKHRVGGVTPRTFTRTVLQLKAFTKKFLEKFVPILPPDTDVSLEGWLKSTSYEQSRQDQLREADKQRIERERVDSPHDVKSFIKEESYWEPKHHRTINSRVDQYKCQVGPWVHAVEKEVFKLKWFIKTVPVQERADLVLRTLDKPGRVKMSTDFTAFESSFRKAIMKAVEFQLFRHVTQNIPGASAFMELYKKIALTNKLKFDSIIAFIAAKRMSGEMSTSIANGFTNLMLILFTAFKQGIPLSQIDLFVEGDDSIISCIKQLTTSYFHRLGYVVKMETHSDIRHASFCGLIFSEPGHIIRDPRPVLAKFGWAMRQYVNAGEKVRMALLRAKAMSIACEYPNCPVLAPFAHRVMELTRSFSIAGIIKKANQSSFDAYDRAKLINATLIKPWQQAPNIIASSRVLMERLYKFPVELQLSWETELSSCTFGQIDLTGSDFFPRDWTLNWFEYVRDYNTVFSGIKRNLKRTHALSSYLPDNSPFDDLRFALDPE